jgi:predicted component of type VI protein secretion system
MSLRGGTSPTDVPVLHVCMPDGRVFRFTHTFKVGRDPECELRVQHPKVSRVHLEVSYRDGHWRIEDTKSANGMFVDGQRVHSGTVADALTVSMGVDGPSLMFELNPRGQTGRGTAGAAPTIQDARDDNDVLADLEEKYFGAGRATGPAGGRTVMIRSSPSCSSTT